MKVALIGASGFVGKIILKELLDRRHEVTAVLRNPTVMPSQAGLQLVQGDVTDQSGFSKTIEGHDAVISSFNAGWQNPNLYQDFLEGSRAIQSAVRQAGVKRLIVVGGAGSLYIDGKQLVDSPDFPAAIKPGATAARDYLNELKYENEIDWVFVSPAIEMHPGTSGTRKGSYRMGTESPVFDEQGKCVISAEDLAVAIVDELEQQAHHRARFTVAY
jgi:putative NADH-flavin reductase